MSKKIFVWMLVFLVLMSGVVVNAEESTIQPDLISDYKNLISQRTDLINKLSPAQDDLRFNQAVEDYKKEYPELFDPDKFKISTQYGAFLDNNDLLRDQKKNLDTQIKDLEKNPQIIEEIAQIKKEQMEAQTFEREQKARLESYNSKINSVWDKDLKANTYSIGGSNFVVTGESGNMVLLEKVGDVKKSRLMAETTAVTSPASAKKDVYAISASDKQLLDESKKVKNIDLSLAITPVKFDSDKMKGNADEPSEWKWKEGNLAGQKVHITSSAFTANDLQNVRNEYDGKLQVVATERGYVVTTTVGGNEKRKEQKNEDRGILGFFGGSSEKQIILKRAEIVSLKSSSFDRTAQDDIMVIQSWDESKATFNGYTYAFKNDDGSYTEIPRDQYYVDAWGRRHGNLEDALKAASYPEEKIKEEVARAEIHSNKVTFNRFIGSLRAAQSWSAISSLFGFELTEWKQTIDEIFHSMFLGSEYWAEAICYQVTDLPNIDENSIFTYDADGNLMQTATIIATKQVVDTPQGRQYLYKISYYIRNPEGGSSNNLGGLISRGVKTSGESGLIARGTSGGNVQELDREEREFWNIIERQSTQIQNERSKYSKAPTNEDMEYNIELSGQRTIYIFEENQIIKPGDNIINTGKNSIASYSNYNYNKACVVFDGVKPRNLFYKEVSEICTDIVDISSETPTRLPQVSDTMGSGFAVNEFSNIRGSGASSGRGFVG